MSVAKTIEITSTSSRGFEDAVREGILRASKTVKGIKNAWVQDQEVMVENNQIVSFQVRMRLTFVLED